MTDQERGAMMEGTALLFVENANKTCQGLTNEELTAKMLGTVAGAIAVMRASGLAWGRIDAGVNSILEQLSS